MRQMMLLALGGAFLAQMSSAQEVTGDLEAGTQAGHAVPHLSRHRGLRENAHRAAYRRREPAYIDHQLTAFRDGTRVHEMMSVVAKGLERSGDCRSGGVVQRAGTVATLGPGQDPAKAPEACVACHGADGIAQIDDAPNLAGETVMYIDTQLKAFRTGKRSHDVMSGIAAEMSNDEIRAVAEWYSSVRFEVTPAQ